MADPSVSVVVPVRNGRKFLRQGLESVFGQTLPPDEVIVVDDGSTDGCAEIARAFSARVISNNGCGASAARNTGIAASRGGIIAFLDHDDLWEPAKLERQIALMVEQPRLSYTWCRTTILVEPGTERAAWVRDEFLTPPGIGSANASSLAMRRLAFDQVGGFNTDLIVAEDIEWIMRARDAGVSGGRVEEALVRYRRHGSNTSDARRASGPPVYLSVLRSSIARRRARADQRTHAG